nr:hypothetical protein [Sicyoidochytrium minutum DNA virus]
MMISGTNKEMDPVVKTAAVLALIWLAVACTIGVVVVTGLAQKNANDNNQVARDLEMPPILYGGNRELHRKEKLRIYNEQLEYDRRKLANKRKQETLVKIDESANEIQYIPTRHEAKREMVIN